MTIERRRRRTIDAVIAAVIAVIAVAAAFVLWHRSDVRATSIVTIPSSQAPTTPAAPTTLPATLHRAWQLHTAPRYGAIASPYGTVVTADTHTVTGHLASDGTKLWSYSRSNHPLCAIGSGDTTTDPLGEWTGVHGIMTVYAKNGYCSQVTLLNPSTGSRLYQRTSPTKKPGQLFFGAPYVGFMSDHYLELWRHDLVDTIRYGDQAQPVKPNGPHLGCTFTDAASSDKQLATIEHCGGNTHLVLNWPTPSDAPDAKDKGWDANHSEPKATIDLAAANAVIVGITADRVAVVVGGASPALVVYDSNGTQQKRTPVHISDAEIRATAKAGITPSITDDGHRYTLVGHHLTSVGSQVATEPAPTTSTTATTAPPSAGSGALTSSAPSAPTAGELPSTVSVDELSLDWIADDALGLPTRVDGEMLVPTKSGLQARDIATGAAGRTIAVDRHGYTGRVDVTAIGQVMVEVRGDTVVGLKP